MAALQERLSTSMANAHHAQQAVTSLEQKLHALEVEKSLAAAAEQRLTNSISQVQLGKLELKLNYRRIADYTLLSKSFMACVS